LSLYGFSREKKERKNVFCKLRTTLRSPVDGFPPGPVCRPGRGSPLRPGLFGASGPDRGTERRSLRMRQALTLPGFSVRLLERLPAARIEQEVVPGPMGVPAVLVKWISEGRPEKRWVAAGGGGEIRVGGKWYAVRFLTRGRSVHPGVTPANPHRDRDPGRKLPRGHPPIGAAKER